jgi:CelD/BcsL family acetyltransferase involved in cellulose biosynthesis
LNLLELEDTTWRELVETRADATLFHHPVWARLLADCYGYRPMALTFTDHGGPVGGMPVIDVSRPIGGRRWASLPFTDHCPPLAGDADDLAGEVLEVARAARLDVFEIRGSLDGAGAIRTQTGFVRHALTISSDQRANWDRLFKNHRRNVRIAERSGVRIVRGNEASDVETFYRLHVRTRRRLGVPVQPRRFFRLVRERLLEPGLGFVLIALHEDVPVAAAIFGAWNGTLLYKYSARDERYAKLDANYLLLWTAIRWANENGYHTLDLGRSDLDQDLLRGFKSGWGAREEPLAYSIVSDAAARLSSRRLEKAMALVIRNSTPWVCQVAGELFYRYAT